MERRTLLQIAGTLALGRAIGLRAAQPMNAAAESIHSGNLSTGRPYPFPMDILYHGSRVRREIALTFDACPRKERPEFSTAIVDFLQKEKIAATFFVSGLWAVNSQAALKELAGVPYFQLGMHGYHHWKSSDLTEPVIASEIERTWETIEQLGGTPQPFFRPPYGDCPPKLVKVAKSLGVLTVMWDVVSGDPNPLNTAERLEHRVLTLTRNGSIVIMHVDDGGIFTPQALPSIVDGLRTQGFSFVSVGDLVKPAAGK
jgi:peptidoglycan/xylan/chitin deacetylase (PgdA/CDA1 family)